MKKLIIYSFCALGLLSACNKKTKELEDDLAAEKAKTELLNNLILNEGRSGISYSFMGNRGFDSTAFTYNQSYPFSWDKGADETYIEDNNDGTYDIYIERYNSIESSENAYIQIDDYNPTLNISNATVRTYARRYVALTDTLATLNIYQYGYNNYGGNTDNITFTKFNLNLEKRTVEIDFTIKDTEADNNNSTGNAMTGRITYNGTIYPENEVSRTSAK